MDGGYPKQQESRINRWLAVLCCLLTVLLAGMVVIDQRDVLPPELIEVQPVWSKEDGLLILDLNAATAEQLEEIPEIGPALSKAIVEHRQLHGAFESVDELLDVRGIGPATLQAISPYLTVGDTTFYSLP